VRRLLRPLLVRLAWWLTTHPGFYSPCDSICCQEVREKAGVFDRRTGDRVREARRWLCRPPATGGIIRVRSTIFVGDEAGPERFEPLNIP
jgi:hypothetical protein